MFWTKTITKFRGFFCPLEYLKIFEIFFNFLSFLGYSGVSQKSVRVIAALCNDAPRLRDSKEMFRKIIDLCRS